MDETKTQVESNITGEGLFEGKGVMEGWLRIMIYLASRCEFPQSDSGKRTKAALF